ncbi:MAG: hypothetical protein COU07_03605 [Candidatus Harrisonbacteria bacterium CG10_big_fil_rev_8_21_14_0_10_40_38]|uniref:SRCR domain-containing protein n=1 Tax=Candidatus Harrisonbacteria bacterium CG10_big_fil_rev_8_21_14_0_10_40_38 TaxID=1974583 RepID=A0A2H0URE3_9BACT|nr:MAG: hypothetical protein COU07_03605 [Candidatus Harrisonbacteria bacterium CG10_big_fil_rev_8_21_14_0_10_40_38]
MNRFKYLITFLSLASVALFFVVLTASASHYGGQGNTTTGWLWGGSTNSSEQGCSGIGAGADCGALGWGSATYLNGGLVLNEHEYGLSIPDSTCSGLGCNIIGGVWFSNVGWVNFQPAGGFPSGGCNPACPNHGVKRSGNGIIGWARVESIREAAAGSPPNNGGFSGWIKMSGIAQNSSSYGVSISPEGHLGGKAWSDEFGWIDFDVNYSGGGPPPQSYCNPTNFTCDPNLTSGVPCTSNNECDAYVHYQCVNQDCRQVWGDPGDPDTCSSPNDCNGGGGGLVVTCSGAPDPAFLSKGGDVTWTPVVTGGQGDITYAWTFMPPPATRTDLGGGKVRAVYDSTGVKDASVTATDEDGLIGSGDCSVNMRWSQLQETIPF